MDLITKLLKVDTEKATEKETRKIWLMVISELRKQEPELANACRPSCFCRGFCPEFKSCGLADTDSFYLAVNDYIKSLN